MSETVPRRPLRRRAYHWLAALPPVLMLGGIPFANRVEPFVLGLPFLLFWILLWVVATSGVMGLIYALDQGAERRATRAAGAPGGGSGAGGTGASASPGEPARGTSPAGPEGAR